MEEQLAKIDEAKANERKEADKALTLKELAIVIGLGYSAVRTMARLPGFPFVAGHVFYSDFVIWRRQRQELSLEPRTAVRRQRSSAGRAG